MIDIYRTEGDALLTLQAVEPGCWVKITAPNINELSDFARIWEIDSDYLRAALDEEETARIESEDGQTLIVVDIPILDETNPATDDHTPSTMFTTIPLAIIMLEELIITICLEEETFLDDFVKQRVKNFYTYYKTRFVLQILYRNASVYMQDLRLIEKSTARLESGLLKSLRNRELTELMHMEQSLVYLATSLQANGVVLEKMVRYPHIKQYPEDSDLLDDVIIENRQAIEMANIYRSILQTQMQAFASIVSNNQNNVMKILTSATIVMTIPQIISGFMGMNVRLPFQGPLGALWLAVLTIIVAALVVIILKQRDMF